MKWILGRGGSERSRAPSRLRLVWLALLAASVLSPPATARGKAKATPLSDHFSVEAVTSGIGPYRSTRLDIYTQQPNGRREYVGTTIGRGPEREIVKIFGGATKGLVAIGIAESEDGRSIVFRHSAREAPRRSKLADGVYRYQVGEGVVLLVEGDQLATFWSAWDREFPSGFIPIRYREGTGGDDGREDVTWAVSAAGEQQPLALIGAGPLHRAAFEGSTGDCAALVGGGAAVDAPTYWDFTPLDFAIIRGHEETALELLKLGADPRAGRYPALHRAVMLGRLSVVRALLDLGAEVNAQDEAGSTPYHVAASTGLTIDLTQFFSVTPGAVLKWKPTQELVQLLLAHGADPTIRDNSGRTYPIPGQEPGPSEPEP